MYPFFDKGGHDDKGDYQYNIRDNQPQVLYLDSYLSLTIRMKSGIKSDFHVIEKC